MPRVNLPDRREADIVSLKHVYPEGVIEELTLTIGRYADGKIAEVFIDIPWKTGWFGTSLTAKDTATLISIALQSGTDLQDMAEAMGSVEVNNMGIMQKRYHTFAGTVLNYLAGLDKK